MKKTLSLLLSVVTLLSILTTATVTTSASSSITYGTTYSHTYSKGNENHKGTLVVPSDGMITVNMNAPSDAWITFLLNDGSQNIVDKNWPRETFYLFLKKGTYSFNFYCNYAKDEKITYKFTHKATYNNKVNSIKWNTKYTHHYNHEDCFGSFSLSSPCTVTFDLTQPLYLDGLSSMARLYIYDEQQNGKEIVSEYFSSSGDYKIKYSVRLNKGKYRFNYNSGIYGEPSYFVEDLLTASYKLSYVKAKKPPTPKLTVNTNKSKYAYSKSVFYRADIESSDNLQLYDGFQFWVKENNGKWKLKEDNENGSFVRYNQFYISATLSKNKNFYYKIRTYSLYGKYKKFSDFTEVRSLNTSIIPKKPTIKTTSPSKKTAKITWKKASGAKGYQIYRSTKKSGGYSKIKTTTATSLTSKGLKSKKTYYFKVRAYTKKHGETIYGKFSSVKSVKIK